MGDLIDRWEAIETICRASCEDMSETTQRQCALNDACEVIEMFKDVPSVEPKRGKWEEKSTFDVDESGEQIIQEWQSARCSVCGKYHTTPYMYYFDVYNFCPNCGADMRGEKE